MDIIELKKIEHGIKVGDVCKYTEPNVKQNSLFVIDNEIVGFYLAKMPDKIIQYINIANNEFNSDNVPKSIMNRSRGELGFTARVRQMSTILGAIAPRPHMKRPYPSVSAVHRDKKAQTFIKAMMLAAKESEKVIEDIMPDQYQKQKKILEESCPKEFRFANLFTSSISNYNIAAPYHIDKGNLIDCVNVIITKRRNSKGGCLNVPDFGLTIEQADNSMLVYPAWRSVHGVTPIRVQKRNGYRNSLIFYPLKAFKQFV